MSWASKRKIIYGGSLTTLFVLIVVIPTFLYWYTPSTCTDGIKNQDERGVDCGGSCVRLCQDDFLPARVSWAKFEWVNKGMYNVSAYIVNPNINGKAKNASYIIQLYDDKGLLITERRGKTNISPYRNSLVFEGAMITQERIPVKAVFEFTDSLKWESSQDTLGDLFVVDRIYNEDQNGSSLQIVLENRSLYDLEDLLIGVVLKDTNDNAIGFSTTRIDLIRAGERLVAPYTWPIDRQGKVVSIEVVPMIYPNI